MSVFRWTNHLQDSGVLRAEHARVLEVVRPTKNAHMRFVHLVEPYQLKKGRHPINIFALPPRLRLSRGAERGPEPLVGAVRVGE